MRNLHIVRLVLDRRELLRVAARHRLPRSVDNGYLLHAGLAQLFASSSERADVPLHNFAVDETHRCARKEPSLVFLIGYSDLDEGALIERMGSSAGALIHQCATKEVTGLSAGVRVGFRVRACPVVRTKHLGEHGPQLDKKGKPKSREVDAWLAYRFARWESQPPWAELPSFERREKEWAEREEVYAGWLARELERTFPIDTAAGVQGATLEAGVRLESFHRDAMHRRGKPKNRRRRAPQRPNAVLEGCLRVADADAFLALLRRGVGRHRAFGFGMLLLRRAS